MEEGLEASDTSAGEEPADTTGVCYFESAARLTYSSTNYILNFYGHEFERKLQEIARKGRGQKTRKG